MALNSYNGDEALRLLFTALGATDTMGKVDLTYTATLNTALSSLVAADTAALHAAITTSGLTGLIGYVKVALAALDTAGGVLSWVNPLGANILVTHVLFDVTTKSTGACTLDVGTTAVSATTTSNNLMTGIDVGTATGQFDNISDVGASGKSRQKIASGKWITASKASGAAAGLVGNAYIFFIPA